MSGYYGCSMCYTEGVYISSTKTGKSGKKKGKVAYPKLSELRTHNSMLVDGTIAENFAKNNKKSFFRGVSGPTQLFKLPGMMFPISVTFDTMHSIDLGVLKMILECWLGHNDRFKAFNLDPEQISMVSLIWKR